MADEKCQTDNIPEKCKNRCREAAREKAGTPSAPLWARRYQNKEEINVKEHEEKPIPKEDAAKVSAAADAFLEAIREMGPEYGAIFAISSPGDACMVGCEMPRDKTKVLQLVTVIVSWLAARTGWSEEDLRVFTDSLADQVSEHIRLRREAAKEAAGLAERGKC